MDHQCVLCHRPAGQVMNGQWLCEYHYQELDRERLQRQAAILAADVREAEWQKYQRQCNRR
jgi:hypothetical protein